VPDTAAQVVVDENGQVSWGGAPLVINPWDEYAVEAALQTADATGGTVTALSLGGESAKDALKHTLAMGCKAATLISDPALAGADSQGVARVLGAAIMHLGAVNLVFFGKQAVDGDGGVTAAQTARVLAWPLLSLSATIPSVENQTIQLERATEEGRQKVQSRLPAVISVVKDIGEPRYPSFMGIRKASRAQIPVITLADLGMSAPPQTVAWPEIMNPPSREVMCELITGDTPAQIAASLADKILAEKVL